MGHHQFARLFHQSRMKKNKQIWNKFHMGPFTNLEKPYFWSVGINLLSSKECRWCFDFECFTKTEVFEKYQNHNHPPPPLPTEQHWKFWVHFTFYAKKFPMFCIKTSNGITGFMSKSKEKPQTDGKLARSYLWACVCVCVQSQSGQFDTD